MKGSRNILSSCKIQRMSVEFFGSTRTERVRSCDRVREINNSYPSISPHSPVLTPFIIGVSSLGALTGATKLVQWEVGGRRAGGTTQPDPAIYIYRFTSSKCAKCLGTCPNAILMRTTWWVCLRFARSPPRLFHDYARSNDRWSLRMLHICT